MIYIYVLLDPRTNKIRYVDDILPWSKEPWVSQ